MKMHTSLARQAMAVFDDQGRVVREYPVSTALAGVGEVFGSFQTPRGHHVIRAKIGVSCHKHTAELF